MSLVAHLRDMARNSAWSNARLRAAVLALSPGEFATSRTGFFPSLALTLHHILLVDRFYLDALETGRNDRSVFDRHDDPPDAPGILAAQVVEDRRLVAFCDGLDAAGLDRTVRLDRGERGLLLDRVGGVLPHLFVHQIHHRGQVHAMLSGTSVAPPQLDEFFLAEDRVARDEALRTLGL
jgi:uncharacterized damage-inducible protein DinB